MWSRAVLDLAGGGAYVLSRMAHDPTRPRLLSDILPRVSRSFYLSLCILPSGVRPALGGLARLRRVCYG